MASPRVSGLRGRLLVLEDGAILRDFDLDLPGSTPKTRSLAAIPSGVFAGKLFVADATTALFTTSGGTTTAQDDSVYFFDPGGTGGAISSVHQDTVSVAVAGTTSSGTPVTRITPSYTAGATLAAHKLYVATSNLIDTTFEYNPGTVLVYDFDPVGRSITQPDSPTPIQTSGYNPTFAAFHRDAANHTYVLVVVTGLFGGSGAIDVIDTTTDTRVARIALGTANPFSRPVITPDGTRAFVGSMTEPHVYQIDISASDPVNWTAVNDASNPIVLPHWDPAGPPAYNYVSDLALSESGKYLFAVNFNDSTITVLDRSGSNPAVVRQYNLGRGEPSSSGNNKASLLALRPGVRGRDFSGPDLFVATINIFLARDQIVPNVTAVIDAVMTPYP
jgi:hypothetical protein